MNGRIFTLRHVSWEAIATTIAVLLVGSDGAFAAFGDDTAPSQPPLQKSATPTTATLLAYISNPDQLYESVHLASQNLKLSLAPGVYDLRGRTMRVLAPLELHGDGQDAGGGTSIIECGGHDTGAMELLAGGFMIVNITFRNCGGAAPVLVDLRNSTSGTRGEISDCRFEGNAGYLAGGVAVIPDSENLVDLNIRGCTFIDNAGKQQHRENKSEHVLDSSPWKQLPMMASALALGRGNNIVSGCNFTSNVPPTSIADEDMLQVSAPVELSCWQGPAALLIVESAFQNNSGQHSGGIYMHDHPDGVTPTFGCSLTVRKVTILDSRGAHSGAILATCLARDSFCGLFLEDTEVSRSYAETSGVITARGTSGGGMNVTATNLTMMRNSGGGAFAAVAASTIMRGCRFTHNTGNQFAALYVLGGSISSFDTDFSYNNPLAISSFLAAAVSVSRAGRGLFFNCTFTGNILHALLSHSSAMEVMSCHFRRNRAVSGAKLPYGAALALLSGVSDSMVVISGTVFENNVALAGGALLLYSTSSVFVVFCDFIGNRAVSGGAVEAINPSVSVDMMFVQCINNTAVGRVDMLYGEDGLVDASAAGTLGGSSTGGTGGGGVTANSVEDYGTNGSGEGVEGLVEGCGNGGGGAVCLRGGKNVQITMKFSVKFKGNKALMGGGLYVAPGPTCQEIAGCYRLEMEDGIVFEDNHADLAGGAVYWLHERLFQIKCQDKDMSLARPTWPGLLDELRSHSFTATTLAVARANMSSRLEAPSTLPSLPPPRPRPPPHPPLPGLGPGRTKPYMWWAAPCASWLGNTVGDGGYGPTIASSAFFHLPVIIDPSRSSSPETSSVASPSDKDPSPRPPDYDTNKQLLPTYGGQTSEVAPSLPTRRLQLHSLDALRRKHLLQLTETTPVAPTTKQGATAEPVVTATGPPPPLAPASPPKPLSAPSTLFASGDLIPVAVYIFDFYGQKVTRSMVDDPSSVLVACNSRNAHGQKTAGPMNGVATFAKLAVRDKVGGTYSITFTARTAIREMNPVHINVTLRPCRINEELTTSGDECVPCAEGSYATPYLSSSHSNADLPGSRQQQSNNVPPAADGGFVVSSGAGHRATCKACPLGATCSSRTMGNVISPRVGYWHSGTWSGNIMKCPYEGACMYENRTSRLAGFQAVLVNAAIATTHGSVSNSPEAYRRMQCAPGYEGNLCASCEEGYGRTSQSGCSRCRGPLVLLGYGVLVFGLTLVSIVATIRAALTPQLSQRHGSGNLQQTPSTAASSGVGTWGNPQNENQKCSSAAGTRDHGLSTYGGLLGAVEIDATERADPVGEPSPFADNLTTVGTTKRTYGRETLHSYEQCPDRLSGAGAVATPQEDLQEMGDEKGRLIAQSEIHVAEPSPRSDIRRMNALKMTRSSEGTRHRAMFHGESCSSHIVSRGSHPTPLGELQQKPSTASQSSHPKQQCRNLTRSGVSQSSHRSSSSGMNDATSRPPGWGILPSHGKVSFASVLMAARDRRLATKTSYDSTTGVGDMDGDGSSLPRGANPSEVLSPMPQELQLRSSLVTRKSSSGPKQQAPTSIEGPASAATCAKLAQEQTDSRTVGRTPHGGLLRSMQSDESTILHGVLRMQPSGPAAGGAGFGNMDAAFLGIAPHCKDLGSGEAVEGPAALKVPGRIPGSEPGNGFRSSDGNGDEAGYPNEEDHEPKHASDQLPRSKHSVFLAGRRWRRRIDIISEHATVIKILVSYLQVVSLVNNTPVTWPRTLVNYFNVAAQASSAASSLAPMDCFLLITSSLPKSAQIFIIAVLSPVYWSVALCLFWVLRAAWLHSRGHLPDSYAVLSYLRVRCIITVNCVIFIQYPSVVSQLFSLFSCMQIDTGPQQLVCVDPWDPAKCAVDKLSVGQYWTRDLEQHCYEGIHLRLCLIVGVPGVIVFAAGIPLFSAWWLYHSRQRLRDDDFGALYGTLYQEYENKYYYWESVVMLRKLAITAVIVFAGTYHWQLTLLLALGVIALALMAQAAYRPYESDAMDELERLGLVTTLITFYLATYFMSDSVGESAQVGLSISILVLNAITTFILGIAILRELHRVAIFKLLRISSARGDLPLSFVLRIGLLYLGWQVCAAWTGFRLWLRGLAPSCFPLGLPPGVMDQTVTVMATSSGLAPVVSCAGGDDGDGDDDDEGQQGGRQHLLAAALKERALRNAWERHHHEAWMRHVLRLEERLPATARARGATGSDFGGGSGRGGDSSWRRIPDQVVQGVKRAAKSIKRISTGLSGRSSLHGQTSTARPIAAAIGNKGHGPESAEVATDVPGDLEPKEKEDRGAVAGVDSRIGGSCRIIMAAGGASSQTSAVDGRVAPDAAMADAAASAWQQSAASRTTALQPARAPAPASIAGGALSDLPPSPFAIALAPRRAERQWD